MEELVMLMEIMFGQDMAVGEAGITVQFGIQRFLALDHFSVLLWEPPRTLVIS
jgi:hypothetical protein